MFQASVWWCRISQPPTVWWKWVDTSIAPCAFLTTKELEDLCGSGAASCKRPLKKGPFKGSWFCIQNAEIFCRVPFGGFLKWKYPQIIRVKGLFHYKPSWSIPILGNLHIFPYWFLSLSHIARFFCKKTCAKPRHVFHFRKPRGFSCFHIMHMPRHWSSMCYCQNMMCVVLSSIR